MALCCRNDGGNRATGRCGKPKIIAEIWVAFWQNLSDNREDRQSTGDNCGTLVVDVFGASPRPTPRFLQQRRAWRTVSAGCPEGQECADDFAMHLASGQVAPEYIGCYQSCE